MKISKISSFAFCGTQKDDSEKEIKKEVSFPQVSEKSEKIVSDAVFAQGQAKINMSKTSRLLQNCTDGQVSTVRGIVKKVKVPTMLVETKSNILSDINAEIESRFLQSKLVNKSAQESGDDILRLNPVDLNARKVALREEYGTRLQEKKDKEKERLVLSAQNRKIRQKVNNLETFMTFLLPDEHYSVDNPPIKERVDRKVCKEHGIDAFTQAYVDKIINSYDSEGLVKILESINTDGPYNYLDREQKVYLSQTVKSQLEFLYYKKQFESNLGEGSAQRSAEFIETEIERISDINAEKETSYLRSQLAHKSAKRSASDIIKLSPVDLGAKKADLQARFADKVQEKRDKEKSDSYKYYLLRDFREFKKAWDERQSFLACFSNSFTPSDSNIDEKIFTKEGMYEYLQLYSDNLIKSYDPNLLVSILDIINNDEEVTEILNLQQKEMLMQSIKSELEFLHYKKQFETDFPKKSAKTSAEIILENSPVDLGQRKIDLQEKFAE